ncbi:unnamed protein product [Absidia cylindrospora]
MTVFRTFNEISTILSDNNTLLVPKLMVLKITDSNSISGYLYILDLQQPYSSATNTYPLSVNFKSLETTLNQVKRKQSEFGSQKANCLLGQLLMELLVGRQQGLLIMDIEEKPLEDDLPQIQKSLSFAQALSSIHGYTSRNAGHTWVSMDPKFMKYRFENEELNAKIRSLENQNQEMKHKIEEAKTTMEASKHQYKTQIGKMTKHTKFLEASLSAYRSHGPKMKNPTLLSQEKLLSIEYAPHSSHEKSQAAKKRKVLSEMEMKMEEMNKKHNREMDTILEYTNQLEAQCNYSKNKCSLLNQEVDTLKEKLQDTATLNTDLEKTVNTQKNTIRHLNFIIEQTTRISDQQKRRSQQEIINLKKEKKEMEHHYRDSYDQLQQEFEQYVENQHYKIMGHKLKHEQQNEKIQCLHNNNDMQQQVIQKLQADTLGHQQIIHDLRMGINEPQAAIQELEHDKILLLERVEALENDASSCQTYIATLQKVELQMKMLVHPNYWWKISRSSSKKKRTGLANN